LRYTLPEDCLKATLSVSRGVSPVKFCNWKEVATMVLSCFGIFEQNHGVF
jgi:hypothetical protein